MGAPVWFEMLGPVRARTGDGERELGPPKQVGVLAVLLLEAGRPVPVEKIIDAVWDERPPADGTNVVSKYVGRLRRILDDTPLRRASGGYLAAVDPRAVDVTVFRQRAGHARRLRRDGDLPAARTELREALALWRGTPLQGLAGPFFAKVRDQLAEQRVAALEDRLDLDLSLGRHEEAVAELAALVDAHPLRERLTALLMLGLYRNGRQAEALVAFQRLRTALADELGIDPGKEVRALHERILRHEEDLEVAGSATGHEVPAPAQLRHEISGFTGRAAPLSELHAALGRPGLTICAIDGPAGVGKTALAVHFAHQVSHRFTDGQIFLDLRGFGPNQAPTPPAEALSHALRALGVVQVPEGLDERAALYRSMLTGRRMLVLLDNAREADQVRPLLPGRTDSLVLITSRRSLGGLAVRDGARQISLGTLSVAEAAELLTTVVGGHRLGREPAAAGRLAELCGQLPLALRIAAQRIAGRPRLSLTDLVAELEHERDRLDLLALEGDETSAIRPVFSWSYHALEPEAAHAFRLLGLHEGPEFGLPVAAALLGVASTRARDLLRALSGAHLVQTIAPGRYHLHDLIRLYAAECAAAHEREEIRVAAVHRMLEWYLATADAAGAVLVPSRRRADLALTGTVRAEEFRSVNEAISWCETERANLLAAHHQAEEAGEDTISWQLAVSLWDFYYLRSHWADWIITHERALPAARRSGGPLAEAGVLTSLGHAYLETGRFEDAHATLEPALICWAKIDDRWGQGISKHLLATTEAGRGRPDQAERLFTEALALHDQTGDRWGTAWSLSTLGAFYRTLGRSQQALETTQRARTIWHELGDAYGEGFVLNDLGDLFLQLQEVERAEQSYRDAVVLNGRIGNRWSEATGLAGIGKARELSGDTDSAQEYRRRALAIFEQIGDARAQELRDRISRRDSRNRHDDSRPERTR